MSLLVLFLLLFTVGIINGNFIKASLFFPPTITSPSKISFCSSSDCCICNEQTTTTTSSTTSLIQHQRNCVSTTLSSTSCIFEQITKKTSSSSSFQEQVQDTNYSLTVIMNSSSITTLVLNWNYSSGHFEATTNESENNNWIPVNYDLMQFLNGKEFCSISSPPSSSSDKLIRFPKTIHFSHSFIISIFDNSITMFNEGENNFAGKLTYRPRKSDLESSEDGSLILQTSSSYIYYEPCKHTSDVVDVVLWTFLGTVMGSVLIALIVSRVCAPAAICSSDSSSVKKPKESKSIEKDDAHDDENDDEQKRKESTTASESYYKFHDDENENENDGEAMTTATIKKVSNPITLERDSVSSTPLLLIPNRNNKNYEEDDDML